MHACLFVNKLLKFVAYNFRNLPEMMCLCMKAYICLSVLCMRIEILQALGVIFQHCAVPLSRYILQFA